MIDPETKQVLLAILEMQKQQVILSTRLLGWLVAVGDTVRANPAMNEVLTQNPFYYQATIPQLDTTGAMLQHIDALIQQLKLQA